MPTDDERRDVARRLRGIKDTREGCGHDMCCDLWSAIFDSDYRCTDLCDECEVAVLNSLADLIEPSDPKVRCVAEVKVDGERLEELVHDAAVELTGIDREALLALADEMQNLANSSFLWNLRCVDVQYLIYYARRIRRALGVSDA